jgi:putative thioredoxin
MDVTDATFESLLERSDEVPVVVDLWAPWCGPCRTLGPIIEKVVDETEGQVVLAKVNVDENPRISATFQVQSIPAVYALKDRKVIDGFIGALPEAQVREFVSRLAPEESEVDRLVALGDESSLRAALDVEPDRVDAVTALARLLVDKAEPDEALALLARIPESPETRHIAALARVGGEVPAEEGEDGVEAQLERLLDHVKDDEQARRQFLDLLELLGPDDPRTPQYRKALTARLF